MAQTMKCAFVSKFGEVDDVVQISHEFPKPKVIPGSGQMLVKVLACSTSPGDIRTLSGSVDFVRSPAFPYVPSQDVCGYIEEIDPKFKSDTSKNKPTFKVGDCIIGTWHFMAVGGMAEYCLIDISNAVLKPPNISPIEGAAVANSAVNAMLAVRDAAVVKGNRVLVLGGSSAVGTIVIQLVKKMGASFIAATSTDVVLLQSLGVDRAINYKEEDWFKLDEFRSNPFDKIFDCAEGHSAWLHAKTGLLKTGWNNGTFLSVVGTRHSFELHSFCATLCYLWNPMIGRPFYTSLNPFCLPRYKMLLGAPRNNSLKELMDLYGSGGSGDGHDSTADAPDAGYFKVILDPHSPFPFTEAGVREALRLQGSRRAHGKVVVKITE